jgi:sugar lactone lactonase YvrE
VQSVVLDPLDRLWILDTGRALLPDGTLVNASPGGPKLVGVDISTGSVIKTIVFPPTVAYPDSYLNDVRFDLRPSVCASGSGVAYITDSSSEGRNGIVIVDLGTGESWRHLDGIKETRAERGFVPYVWGQPLYYIPGPNEPLTTVPLGSDGIALSADGETLFFGPVGGRGLYSIPTARLRDRSQTSELLAQTSISNNGERGVSDGFETDTNGFIYAGNMEQNEIHFHNPANGTNTLFVRDPRISWVDTSKFAQKLGIWMDANAMQCLWAATATSISRTTSSLSLRRSTLVRIEGRGRLCCSGRLCRVMDRGYYCSKCS